MSIARTTKNRRLRILPLAVGLVVVVLLFFLVEGIQGNVLARIPIAFSLLGTFVLFPFSGTPILSVDSSIHIAPSLDEDETAPVPRLIHQVKLGGLEMKPKWKAARQSCLDLHPQWTFKLWQDQEADTFVQEHYPAIWDYYRSYKLEIQRANILRYLVLDHHGGMYLDLDLKCLQPLDSLRNQSFVTPPANPTGINNAFIVSTKGHPFWAYVVQAIPRYDLQWFNSPYLTNMFSTGCHFLSTVHRLMPHSDRLKSNMRILDQQHKLNGHVVTPLFEHLGASSWHKGDAKLVLLAGKFVEFLKSGWAFLLLSLVAPAIFVIAFIRRRIRTRRVMDTSRGKYSLLTTESRDLDSEECMRNIV